jgi:hypothetical protein
VFYMCFMFEHGGSLAYRTSWECRVFMHLRIFRFQWDCVLGSIYVYQEVWDFGNWF